MPATTAPSSRSREMAMSAASISAATRSALDFGVGRHDVARLVFRRRDDHGGAGLLELLEVVAGDAAILREDDARLGPFPVVGELDVADYRLEGGLVDVLGDLGLVDALGLLDRLAEDLHR